MTAYTEPPKADITPQMIEAGAQELWLSVDSDGVPDSREETVALIYRAMLHIAKERGIVR